MTPYIKAIFIGIRINNKKSSTMSRKGGWRISNLQNGQPMLPPTQANLLPIDKVLNKTEL
jgi:hypothetical protein